MKQEGYLDTVDHLDSRQFLVAVKKLADSLGHGSDRSPFLGAGFDYVQSRPYQFGDPIRSIDWRVTARTGRPYLKEYEAPRRMPCYLLFDTSASMVVSSAPRSKYAVALHLAGGLAFACLDRISPVGVIGVGGREYRVEPSLSRARALEWLHQLRRYRHDEPTAVARRVAELAPVLPSRSLVLVLSDLHDPGALSALGALAQRHDVAVFQLLDPAERGVPGAGFLRAREAETGRSFVTRAGRKWTDPEPLAAGLRRAGLDHLVIQTDQPFAARVRHFCRSRNLLGRGAR
jgi:uncharacterized protein (DUF58 family)